MSLETIRIRRWHRLLATVLATLLSSSPCLAQNTSQGEIGGFRPVLPVQVTNRLKESGYFLAEAYLPPQKAEDGVVEIAVLEGSIGRVRVEQKGDVPVSPSIIDGIISAFPPRAPVGLGRDADACLCECWTCVFIPVPVPSAG